MKIVGYLWTNKKYLPSWLSEQEEKLEIFAKKQGGQVVGVTKDDRPRKAAGSRLEEAARRASQYDAILVIPHIKPMLKKSTFLKALRGVTFCALDAPEATPRNLEALIQTALSGERAFSEKQKRTLADRKAAGVKLGSAREGHWTGREDRRGTRQAIAAASRMRTKRAKAAYKDLEPLMMEKIRDGWSYQAIADWLTIQDYQTTAGKPFTSVAVWRILRRAGGVDSIKPPTDRSYKPAGKRIIAMAAQGHDALAIAKRLPEDGCTLPDGHVFTVEDVMKLGGLW